MVLSEECFDGFLSDEEGDVLACSMKASQKYLGKYIRFYADERRTVISVRHTVLA